MIQIKEISSHKDPLFQFCWELYLSAFPESERRELDYQIETMGKEEYHCFTIVDSDNPIGILFWWDLKEFAYIEHLATTPEVRGKGYGNQIMEEFISQGKKRVLLEVEHPTDEICLRRIRFYERMGFVLNHHPYYQPSLKQVADEHFPLMIMTYPSPITECELQEFMSKEFPTIHFRNFR